MKLLFSTGIGFKTHTLKELEQRVLSEGYDGIELNMPSRHVPAHEANRDTAYDSVSTVRVIHAPGDVYDTPRFENALRDTLTLAKQLKVPVINIHPSALSQGGRDNVLQGITLVKKMEQETGITIAYEVLVTPLGLEPERQSYFLEQQAYLSLEDYVADVKKYSLSATLDTAHVGTWGVNPHELIPVLGENLKHVHVSDYSSVLKQEHLLLGDGDVDLPIFLQTLQQHAPDITVTIELNPPDTREGVVEAIQKSMKYIRNVLPA